MRLILNQFNPYDGKYQIPARVEYKTKMAGEWMLMVVFPKGTRVLIPARIVEEMAIKTLNLRKIRTY